MKTYRLNIVFNIMKLIKRKKIFILIPFLFLFFLPVNAEEKEIFINEHEINFYSGMFDFSDDGMRSSILDFNIKMKIFLETVF